MTSHVRHRRGASVPPLIESGELRVDTANRQLVVGDIDGSAGVPLAMVAVRYFDVRASYALHDYAVQAGSLYRANVAISPGPFNASQWTVVSGDPGSGGAPEHTPLHGYSNGANRTLILHNTVDDVTNFNTIDFNNLSGLTTARIFGSGLDGNTLRIQSTGNIALAPYHVGFDDNFNLMTVNADNVTIRNGGVPASLILKHTTVAGGASNALEFRNNADVASGNIWVTGSPADGLWLQSGGAINLVPGHTAIDGVGIALQVDVSGVNIGGPLSVQGTVDVANHVVAGGSLTLGANSQVVNTSGFLDIRSAAALYLRSPSVVVINDLTAAPVVTGGALQVGGPLTAVQGATVQSDLTVYRSGAPTTGVIYLGNQSKGLNYDGVDLHTESMRGVIVNEPVIPTHAASKNYVDSKVSGAAAYLPLAGGTMTGAIVTAPGGDLLTNGPVASIQIWGTGSTWATETFHVPGIFGANFGLKADGNFYMGGFSHGSNAYKFWTTRDFTTAPINGVRLSLAADYTLGDAVAEPYPGAVLTGLSTNASSGLQVARYRYLQILLGSSWVTVALA